MEELKPCPFCGGNAELNFSESFYRVRCANDTCYGYHFSGLRDPGFVRYADHDAAIKAWNTRADRTCRIAGDNEDPYFIECSSCNALFSFDYIGHDWKYCPSCGAKITKEKEQQ